MSVQTWLSQPPLLFTPWARKCAWVQVWTEAQGTHMHASAHTLCQVGLGLLHSEPGKNAHSWVYPNHRVTLTSGNPGPDPVSVGAAARAVSSWRQSQLKSILFSPVMQMHLCALSGQQNTQISLCFLPSAMKNVGNCHLPKWASFLVSSL